MYYKTDQDRVAVALSGGVDSSVSTALLLEQGYKVFAIHMKLWKPKNQDNKILDDLSRAKNVAKLLGIKLLVVDYEDLFKEKIYSSYLSDLQKGFTPNPCVICNRLIKWGALLNFAIENGADSLATGHYARLMSEVSGGISLWKGIDQSKDQSYVLSVLSQPILQQIILPLGEYSKSEIKQIGHSLGLIDNEDRESQDLCFLGGMKQKEFIQKYAKDILIPGEMVNMSGEIVGSHNGLPLYTIGQRKGIRIAYKEPLFVIDKNVHSNQLIVGTKQFLQQKALLAGKPNWISGSPPNEDCIYEIKIRYKATPLLGKLKIIENDNFIVQFVEYTRDITPGQQVVIYSGDQCLGSGEIQKSFNENLFEV